MFQKFQEIFFQIDTNIFQFDLLEAEKIGSKDCNPTQKLLKKIEKILLNETDYFANFGSNFLTFYFSLL